MSDKINKGDIDLVSEKVTSCVSEIALLIEGKFIDEFKAKFVVDGRTFTLELKEEK